MILSPGHGLQWLTETLHLCGPLTYQDIPHLKEWISESWVNLAMVDYPYASDFLQPLPAWPIQVTGKCYLIILNNTLLLFL